MKPRLSVVVPLVRIAPARVAIAASKPLKVAGPWRTLFHMFLVIWLVCIIARAL